MSRRTFKCNNIQQNVIPQTQNLKNPIKPKKNHRAGLKKTKKNKVFPNPEHASWTWTCNIVQQRNGNRHAAGHGHGHAA